MKKLVAVLLASMIMLSGCNTNTPKTTGGMKPGTYTASAAGFHGDITLDVTVDETKITDIQIKQQTETESIGAVALPILVEKVLKNQTIGIDAVSGATVTSTGFKDAMTAALTQAGADMEKMAKAVDSSATEKEKVSMDVDVVVVGAGASGLTAALTAQQNGKKVILLEKTGVAGGASAMAGGSTMATGSDWEKEDGYGDSAEKLKADLMKNGHNFNDEDTVDLYVNSIADSFNWIVSPDGGNVPYQRSGKPSRAYSGEGRGSGVVSSLSKTFTDAGGTLLTNTPANELIVENGVVKGVKAASDDKEYTINSASVILASGGYGANNDLVPTEFQSFVYAGHAGATGDGLAMTEVVNADRINMEFVNTQPNSMILPSGLGQYCNPGVSGAYSTSGAFLVNQDGVRFANEEGNAWDLMQGMKKNTSQYLIMDQASFDAFNKGMTGSKIYTMEDVDKWLANDGVGNPNMVKAETLADLSTKLKLPTDSLTASVTKFNEDVTKGGKDEFGRELKAELKGEGPYYALQMYIRYYATLGGLHINDQMQVLDATQTPISGLYAAGEVVGGLEGDVYMGSTLFGWAVTSGYNAGNVVSGAVKK